MNKNLTFFLMQESIQGKALGNREIKVPKDRRDNNEGNLWKEIRD